jgi:hypothetical protein
MTNPHLFWILRAKPLPVRFEPKPSLAKTDTALRGNAWPMETV